MRYGNAELGGSFVLGPMAAYTDVAFRLLCRQRGAAMCFTEFSNANAIVRNVPESFRLMRTCEEEMPVGIQIFGSEEEVMKKAVQKIGEMVATGELFASCVDINFGCPSGSVIRAGAGSALLRKPEKISAIVSACVSASELPITTKIRAGWNSDNAIAIAKLIEKAGAAGITVHWRTATEGRQFCGTELRPLELTAPVGRKRGSGWEVVGEVKKEVSIPVIGNGGASSPEKAVRFLRETLCDAVMISSAALGNPGIFGQANALLGGKETPAQNWKARLADFQEYAKLAEKHGVLSPKPLRSHAIEFLAGFPGVKEARKKLNAAKTVGEMIGIMQNFQPSDV